MRVLVNAPCYRLRVRIFLLGAQAASLQFAAACHEHGSISGDAFDDPSGKLPDRAGWQPALPKTTSRLYILLRSRTGAINWSPIHELDR